MTLRSQLLFITAFVIATFSVIACMPSNQDEFAFAKEAIVMRDIGHKILLSSGDSVSRVLPINKITSKRYQIRFENAFHFSTDSMIKIVRQAAHINHLSEDYLVDVVDDQSHQVVYGFAVLKTPKVHLLPCKGRKQPTAHYAVNITINDANTGLANNKYLLGAGGGFTALLLIFSALRASQPEKKSSVQRLDTKLSEIRKTVMIGQYAFYRDEQYLKFDGEQIKLSDKETKILNVLAHQLNIIVERNNLQKIWEDDGVIVGRSLDMFVSKLRKKLQKDSAVRLVNVHGKGYKLEVI